MPTLNIPLSYATMYLPNVPYLGIQVISNVLLQQSDTGGNLRAE